MNVLTLISSFTMVTFPTAALSLKIGPIVSPNAHDFFQSTWKHYQRILLKHKSKYSKKISLNGIQEKKFCKWLIFNGHNVD